MEEPCYHGNRVHEVSQVRAPLSVPRCRGSRRGTACCDSHRSANPSYLSVSAPLQRCLASVGENLWMLPASPKLLPLPDRDACLTSPKHGEDARGEQQPLGLYRYDLLDFIQLVVSSSPARPFDVGELQRSNDVVFF